MEIKGDFLGFEFNGYRSEDLGIVRTSDGDRYNENLHPEINDITAEVPGMDGNYYFGSTFGVKNFTINIAFDSLTEGQFRKLRRVFGIRNVAPLIFDERPYKRYLVKLANPIELNYICFDEDEKLIGTARDGVRRDSDSPTGWEQVIPYVKTGNKIKVYKGEGTIEFIAYFPYAKSTFKEIPTGRENEDWVAASGILSSSNYSAFDTYDNETGEIKVYNPGDVETGFRLYIPFSEPSGGKRTLAQTTLTYIVNEQNIAELIINAIEIDTESNSDLGILIDTNTGLITGVSVAPVGGVNSTYTTSGNLYNQYVSLGNFFKIQPSIAVNNSGVDNSSIEITGGNNGIQIFYDYLYF